MKKAIKIKLDVFCQDFYVIEGEPDEAFAQLPKKLQIPELRRDFDLDSDGMCFVVGAAMIIWLRPEVFKGAWYGILAHELSHGINLMFDRMGCPPVDKDNDETFAYCIGYLMQEVLVERKKIFKKENPDA